MRVDLLKAAEAKFFSMYPEGFSDPEMIEIGKKHKVSKMTEMTQELFAPDKFGFVNETVENMIKVITRSSLVSVFEKPKFRDYARGLNDDMKVKLVNGLYEQLHGDQGKGFNQVIEVLVEGKMAKWSLISVIPYYFSPKEEPFMKPTTVKGIVNTFELEGLVYKPRPSYDFYVKYRKQFMEMQQLVHPSLSPDNAAFSGFLMITMEFGRKR